MKKFPLLELKFIEGESLQLVVSLLVHYSIKITTGEILAFFHIYSTPYFDMNAAAIWSRP